MKKLLTLVAIVTGIAPFIFSQTIEVSDTIKTNTTWTADTVKVLTDLVINDYAKLTITPGTRVEFQGNFNILVFGDIQAIGSPSDSIVFTVNDTTGFSSPDSVGGGWRGILYDNEWDTEHVGVLDDNDTSRFSHCIFEFVKKEAAVRVHLFPKLDINNCLFQNIGIDDYAYALFVSESPIKISYNHFTNNKVGVLIKISLTQGALFEGNQVINNFGVAINITSSSAIVRNNLIANNEVDFVGAGGAVMLNRAGVSFINNTISNNKSLYGGAGVYNKNSTPTFINTILWGNRSVNGFGDQVRIADENIQPSFINCIIEGGKEAFGDKPFTAEYVNNIESDPEFVMPSSGAGLQPDALDADWSLKSISVAINSGEITRSAQWQTEFDLLGKPRIRYSYIDIGAFEYQKDVIEISADIDTDTILYADTVKFTNSIEVTDGSTLVIPPGTIVDVPGQYQLSINGRILAQGTPEEKILFTSSDTAHFDLPDSIAGWGGFLFYRTPESNDTSRFSHCIFEYGKAFLYASWNGGIFYVYHFGKLVIEDCLFRNNMAQNGGAIWTEFSHIRIKNNIFINNLATVKSSYRGGAMFLNESHAIVERNIIINNYARYGSAIYINGYVYAPEIVNNVICNNYGPNFGTSAIYCKTVNPIIVNNTICYNKNIGIMTEDSDPMLANNILWNNGSWFDFQLVQIKTTGNSNVDIYNCIVQGGIYGIVNGIGNGTSENIIDTLPGFVNPSKDIGFSEDAADADWSLNDFSPAIDRGILGIPGIPITDFTGNPRINNGKIDIGAYENQATIPEILAHPNNQIKCEGEKATFEVMANDTARIQWFRGGDSLSGDTLFVLVIDSLTGNDVGNYTCRLSNAYGEVETIPAYLFITEKPVFLQEPKNLWVERDEPAIIKVFARGTNLSYQWQKNGANISDEETPELNFSSAAYSDEGSYRCIISNKCASDTSREATLSVAPQICMVTISTVTGNNLVVWEKSTSAPITDYNIYRESTAAGIYDLMATVPAGDLSVWEDTTADPTKRAYIYKITGTDDTGYETPLDLCKPHKTIHLLVSTNPELNSTQLLWDRYFGFDYQTYSIYRSTTQSNFTIVDYMPSSLHSWTETDAGDLEVFYRVSVEKLTPCIPTGGGKKADSGPYSHALSNVDDNRLQAGQAPPDTIILSNHSIDENNMIGALIGRLSTIDSDTLDAHTYQLVPGEGDDGNGAFTLIGDLLVAADYFDYESQDNYYIRVRCLDNYDNYVEHTFTVTINNVAEPTGYQRYSTQPIMVYPNPFNSSTTVVFPNQDEKEYRLLIMDLSGKVVRSIDNINTSSFILQKENLEKGLYLIELRGERIYRGRIVIE